MYISIARTTHSEWKVKLGNESGWKHYWRGYSFMRSKTEWLSELQWWWWWVAISCLLARRWWDNQTSLSMHAESAIHDNRMMMMPIDKWENWFHQCLSPRKWSLHMSVGRGSYTDTVADIWLSFPLSMPLPHFTHSLPKWFKPIHKCWMTKSSKPSLVM